MIAPPERLWVKVADFGTIPAVCEVEPPEDAKEHLTCYVREDILLREREDYRLQRLRWIAKMRGILCDVDKLREQWNHLVGQVDK